MGLLTYANIFLNNSKSDAVKINANFNAISTVVNGNLESDNFDHAADLTVGSVTTNIIYANNIVTDGILLVKLPSNDGTHKFSFQNYLGQDVLRVASDRKVTFYGHTPHLPVGTLLMYNGSSIPDAASRSNDLSTLALWGWYVCNGKSGTPNLIDKFIRGDSIAGLTGGNDDAQIPSHTHVVSVIGNNSVSHQHNASGTSDAKSVAHTHIINVYSQNGGAGDISAGGDNGSGSGSFNTDDPAIGGGHTHTFTNTVSGTNGATHIHNLTTDIYTPPNDGIGRNIPPYYSLIFIRRMI
jgi:hypothetical protein